MLALVSALESVSVLVSAWTLESACRLRSDLESAFPQSVKSAESESPSESASRDHLRQKAAAPWEYARFHLQDLSATDRRRMPAKHWRRCILRRLVRLARQAVEQMLGLSLFLSLWMIFFVRDSEKKKKSERVV